MRYLSTRGSSIPVRFSEALLLGLASDGGLFVPETIPTPGLSARRATLPVIARELLSPFLAEDRLATSLPDICRDTFSFPIPLRELDADTSVLELFHGPTAAFKDVGARFLAECVTRLRADNPRPATVLVATSGDTGGAVAAAFYDKPGIDVMVLFPHGRVSARQEKQLCAWGGNVRAIAIQGDFDDCQKLVKSAFADPTLRRDRDLISANSINIGRLLPQAAYYAWASLEYLHAHGRSPGIIVPSGNLGNGLAAILARKMGYPIREVVLATNANRPIPDYLSSGRWEPQATIATSANAMDVGNPSNMERLRHLHPDVASLASFVRAFSIDDAAIAETIRNGRHRWNQVFCPHTATAVRVRELLSSEADWIIAATAHPAKFETIVEPLIGHSVEIPAALERLLSRPASCQVFEPSFESLRNVLAGN